MIRLAVATLLLVVMAWPALGLVCLDRAVLVAKLTNEYGEVQIGAGLSNGGTKIELYVGSEGTFTILSCLPSGVCCVVNAGTD